MATERVGDMTLEELKTFVEQVVNRRLSKTRQLGGTRSVQDINDSIRRHRWTPPPGAKSSLELLREDRDR
jgi:hypothetical protein